MKKILNSVIFFFIIIGSNFESLAQNGDDIANFCDIYTRIRDAQTIPELKSILYDHLNKTLGNFEQNQLIGQSFKLESPIGVNDKDAITFETIRRVFYKYQVGDNRFIQRELADAKIVANEILPFFDNICEVFIYKDPIIRSIKIFDKLLSYGENPAGHLGFIVKLTRIYLDVTIKALQYVDFLIRQNSTYATNNGVLRNIYITIDKSWYSDYQILTNFIKVCQFELVSETGNTKIPLSAYLGDGSNTKRGRSIRLELPLPFTDEEDKRHFLRIKMGNSENVVIIPINTKLATTIEDNGLSQFYNLRIIGGKMSEPKKLAFKLI